MENQFDQLSIRATTRAAGLMYLLIVVCSTFCILYVPSKLFVNGDADATARNIVAFDAIFRLGMLCDIIVFLGEIVLTVLLYKLLKPVSSNLSMIAAIYRLAMTFIMGINLLNYFFVLVFLSGAPYLAVFETDQLNALVMLFVSIHKYGEYIWTIFFALHLMVLGYLVFKSGFFPQFPGVFMMAGSVGHLLESFRNFLLPDNETISMITSVFLLFSFVGEISFALWLLIKGVRYRQPRLDIA
jgi:hypothetical protein